MATLRKKSKPLFNTWYWVIFAVIVIAVIVMVQRYYDADAVNQKYAQPFQNPARLESNGGSYSPQAPGFRESELQKFKGRHYETY